MMTQIRTLTALTATAGVFALASAASAATELSIDLNDFTVTSGGSNGVVDTLNFGTDDDTAITEIRLDGDPAATFTSGVDVSGSLSLGAGNTVTGGSFTLVGEGGSSYTVSNVSGQWVDSGNAIEISLFLNGTGEFDSDTFEGVDVSDFSNNALPVSIIGFNFDRELFSTIGAVDEDASIDLLTVVPSPTAATAGLGLMGVLALGKRRKA